MQKKILLSIITLIATTVGAHAQITVTNATFPAAGDTLRIATDFAPAGLTVTGPGGPYTWDYSSLKPTTRDTIIFQPASNGSASASFPTADLMTISEGGTETYYDVTSTVFASLGFSGDDGGANLPFATTLVFNPPLPERHAPLTFPNVFASQTAFGFSIATSELPGGLLDSLGIGGGFLDSIRLRITINRNDFVDAYGTVIIPGGTYQVLREKRTDISDARLEIHIPFLGWQDVTQLIPFEGFGRDTSVSYNFISNTEKEPIAVLTMDSTGVIVEEAVYKDNGIASSVGPLMQKRFDINVSPNPATMAVTFDLSHLETGRCILHLYDMKGQQVLQQQLSSERETVSLLSLDEGMYIYQITDRSGRYLSSGTLVKSNR